MKHITRTFSIAALALASTLTFAADGDLSKMDQTFVMKASGAGMYEVAVSQLALEKAADPSIKEFAQMMVTDHTKANEELKQLAGQKNVPVAPGIPKEKQSVIDKLAKLDGAKFDQAYRDQVGLKDHKADISLFEKEAKSGADADLKAWASKTLPTLKGHLQHAQQVKPKA